MPYLVEGWTDDDQSASSKWTNTEYHSCEVGRRRYMTPRSARLCFYSIVQKRMLEAIVLPVKTLADHS